MKQGSRSRDIPHLDSFRAATSFPTRNARTSESSSIRLPIVGGVSFSSAEKPSGLAKNSDPLERFSNPTFSSGFMMDTGLALFNSVSMKMAPLSTTTKNSRRLPGRAFASECGRSRWRALHREVSVTRRRMGRWTVGVHHLGARGSLWAFYSAGEVRKVFCEAIV